MAVELAEEVVRVGEVELSLLRPVDPEALLDEDAFARDEFLPYWAELWPAGLALAGALPPSLAGTRVLELGCGLGIPSLVAAVLAADVLYEQRNVEPLLALLPGLTAEVLLAEPGRPYFGGFLEGAQALWVVEELRDRVYRLRRRGQS